MIAPGVLFQIVTWSALPFWLLMILAPRWRWTKRLLGSVLAPALFALLYVVLLAPILPEVLVLLMRPDLESITKALGTPEGATLAWVHFVCFDLFVGRWQYLDAQQRGLPQWRLASALLVTLFIGPFGLLLYLLVLRGDPSILWRGEAKAQSSSSRD